MEHVKKYTLEGLKQLARESGFEIEEVKAKAEEKTNKKVLKKLLTNNNH